uniref:Uncharacterized protein n=1 Tax=Opuntia streptacantha TaxID=393608 RepID=A0A7C9DVQ9_OPUST
MSPMFRRLCYAPNQVGYRSGLEVEAMILRVCPMSHLSLLSFLICSIFDPSILTYQVRQLGSKLGLPLVSFTITLLKRARSMVSLLVSALHLARVVTSVVVVMGT